VGAGRVGGDIPHITMDTNVVIDLYCQQWSKNEVVNGIRKVYL